MENKLIVLECVRVKFYSSHDEDAFFEWINKITSIKKIKGVGDKVMLFVAKEGIVNDEIFDLYALFKRYGIKTNQINQVVDSKNLDFFNTHKNDFHINRYPIE